MKHFNIILIIALIIISCKLFDDENGDNNDKKIPIPYDYELGETFELKADSSVVIRDSTNNKYYTLSFSGPVTDNRTPIAFCDPNNYDITLKFATIGLELIENNDENINFSLEMMGCVLDTSHEQSVKIGNDQLGFAINKLTPYPVSYQEPIEFKNYSINLTIDNITHNYAFSGLYKGKFIIGPNSIPFDLEMTFDDSSYIGLYPNKDGGCCVGEYHRFKNTLLFTNQCNYDGHLGFYTQVFAFKGAYKYELINDTLHIYNEKGWNWNRGMKYLLIKYK